MEKVFRLNCNTGRNFIELRSRDLGDEQFLKLEMASCGRAYSRGEIDSEDVELVDRHFLEIKDVLVKASDMVGLVPFFETAIQDVKGECRYEMASPEGLSITFILKNRSDVVIECLKNTLTISIVSMTFRVEIVLIVELTVLTAAYEELSRWVRWLPRQVGGAEGQKS